MEILGSLGQMYMFILLVLLFIGSGIAAWAFINNLTSKNSLAKSGAQDKANPSSVSKPVNNNVVNSKQETDKKSGGFKITDSRWYKLAVYSLIGILLSVTLLGFTATNSDNSAHNHSNSQSAMNGPQMGSMPVNNLPVNNGMPNDYMMMQQLYMMQQQLNRMQQQMMNMQMQKNKGGMNMQQSGGVGGM